VLLLLRLLRLLLRRLLLRRLLQAARGSPLPLPINPLPSFAPWCSSGCFRRLLLLRLLRLLLRRLLLRRQRRLLLRRLLLRRLLLRLLRLLLLRGRPLPLPINHHPSCANVWSVGCFRNGCRNGCFRRRWWHLPLYLLLRWPSLPFRYRPLWRVESRPLGLLLLWVACFCSIYCCVCFCCCCFCSLLCCALCESPSCCCFYWIIPPYSWMWLWWWWWWWWWSYYCCICCCCCCCIQISYRCCC
jgi:hypothetical protein